MNQLSAIAKITSCYTLNGSCLALVWGASGTGKTRLSGMVSAIGKGMASCQNIDAKVLKDTVQLRRKYESMQRKFPGHLSERTAVFFIEDISSLKPEEWAETLGEIQHGAFPKAIFIAISNVSLADYAVPDSDNLVRLNII